MNELIIEQKSFLFWPVKGYSVAANFKAYSSAIARSIYGRATPQRPHFLLESEQGRPSNPVAMLVSDPHIRFAAACREDRIDPLDAIAKLQSGEGISFHFLPQARFLSGHDQDIYCWRAPDHIAEFWGELDLGEPPAIYAPQDFERHAAVEELYADDFELFRSITSPRQKFTVATQMPPSIAMMISSFTASAMRFIKNRAPTTPPEILAARESTCRACHEWDAAALNNTGRCKKCGCSTWAKLRMATERCPLGKWEAVDKPTN